MLSHPIVECKDCKTGWSLQEKVQDLEEIIKCKRCGNEFSVLTGIKNDIKSENEFSIYQFISSMVAVLNVEIKIGYAQYISLPKGFVKVFKVFTTPAGPCHVTAKDIYNSGFVLMSSCDVNSNQCVVGEKVNISIFVYGKGESNSDTWRELLSYSREHYLSGDFATSILLAEISFESYVDKILSEGLLEKGLDANSISRFLVNTEMPEKVNPLMNNLFGKKLSQCKAWGNWEKKVLKWRNEIAHGNRVAATKEEAKLAFDTIIDSMFYFNLDLFTGKYTSG